MTTDNVIGKRPIPRLTPEDTGLTEKGCKTLTDFFAELRREAFDAGEGLERTERTANAASAMAEAGGSSYLLLFPFADAQNVVQPAKPGVRPLAIKLAANQSAKAFQLLNSSGGELLAMTAAGVLDAASGLEAGGSSAARTVPLPLDCLVDTSGSPGAWVDTTSNLHYALAAGTSYTLWFSLDRWAEGSQVKAVEVFYDHDFSANTTLQVRLYKGDAAGARTLVGGADATGTLDSTGTGSVEAEATAASVLGPGAPLTCKLDIAVGAGSALRLTGLAATLHKAKY